MNKFFALACTLLVSGVAVAQTQEVQYVEAPEQGYLFNRFQDNWFISVEGGANVYFSYLDRKADFSDRIAPNAGLWVGKWFSPIVGARLGLNFTSVRGIGYNQNSLGALLDKDLVDGKYYKTKRNEFGPNIDLMLNLTNWWCGYKPTRVYNATFYGGGGVNWQFVPEYDKNGKRDGWENGHNTNLTAHVGLINSFRLNKHFNLYLDIRYNVLSDEVDRPAYAASDLTSDLAAYVGLTYNFNKTTWSAPVVPVCPPPVDCSPIERKLQAANARIADLEGQLEECLNRPVEVKEVAAGPLATVYFTIGRSNLNRVDNKVLGAIANIIKANPDKKYVVTGWADNYTGTPAVNDRLRKARAAAVERVLLRNGVNKNQLEVTTDNGNLNDMGEKYVSLDRAVTIKEAE